jgi:hypothetical protein
MDYLDTKKQFRNHIVLLFGYLLVAVAITMSALILLYQAYGFGVTKNGTVTQSGLVYFSSHPSPADIYVNGVKQSARTNSRLELESGVYKLKISRADYSDWQRTIEVEGGSVKHYDYPLLFPNKITPARLQTFDSPPALSTQSLDRRWLLIQSGEQIGSFTAYDLKSFDRPPVTISLPANILTKAASSEGWQLAEWADDNKHVLLQHSYDEAKSEYILLDRSDPAKSINLNATLQINPSKLALHDKKYDQYEVYDTATASLQFLNLSKSSSVNTLQRVLAYKTYGKDTVLYVTDSGAPKDKVLLKMLVGKKVWTLRNFPAGTSYVLDLAKYSGDLYVAAGAAVDNRAYIYKDPIGQLASGIYKVPVPQQVLHVDQVNQLSFSSSAQFIAAENGNRFGVYDLENKVGFNYTAPAPIDPPQTYARWMDGNRLAYTSGGKLLVFDYDNLNAHALSGASGGYLPAFAPDYKYVYSLAPAVNGQFELLQTALLNKADL